METGEKLTAIDTGNDGINYWGNWYFWNDVTSAGMPISSWWPENGAEGAMVAGAFKFISPGGDKFTVHWILQLHRNAKDELVVDNYKYYEECN